MNVIHLQSYLEKRKNQTWLYKLSFHELFDEFVATYHRFEENPENGEISTWLDLVSDTLNRRFFISDQSKKLPLR